MAIIHTDAGREYQYHLKTVSGHLEKALVDSKARGRLVVDWENDLSKIFPSEK
jgi:hypothetical protein